LLTPAGRYAQWYVDDTTVNQTFAGSITLAQLPSGAFQYSCDGTACDSAFPGNPTGFFPLDGRGWVAAGMETPRDGMHNYSFTTEARYWFTYGGGERLDFFGDDDLWVFVNGRLALDIGGIHQKLAGFFQLATDGTGTVCVENLNGQGAANNCTANVNFGLTPGLVYEVAIFHAEREVIDSNFQLTLQGFNSAPSVCTPICGDGFVAGAEQCDRGTANVPPGGDIYGKCTTECKLGPYCGDAILQSPPEACDNGLNVSSYTPTAPPAGTCAPGCLIPAYCGDGVTNREFGEECDDAEQNQNTYGHCQTNCKLGPRCGDGVIQASFGETCDDGPSNTPDGYGPGKCLETCQRAPFCGDGKVDSAFGEQCDSTPGCDSVCHGTR
jgi:fibro-slime domain-containing protein